MKIHVYLLCYNEDKIIRKVIEHYSVFCTKIFILDNYSTDKSVDIAESFPNVQVIKWKSDGKIDESLYVKMKSETYKSYSRKNGRYTEEVADWIISCDMDELLYHQNLKDILNEYEKLNVTVPAITGFDMVSTNEISNKNSLLDQYKYGVRSPGFDKRILFKCDFNIAYNRGCHPQGVGFEYMKKQHDYLSSNLYPIALLHFKHVGSRHFNSALKNYERLKDTSISKQADGTYVGLGSHYANIVNGNKSLSPLIGKEKKVLNYSNEVMFSAFPPSTGEKGIISNVSKLSHKEVELIRNSADSLKKIDKQKAIDLLELALKSRPNGALIKTLLDTLRKDNV